MDTGPVRTAFSPEPKLPVQLFLVHSRSWSFTLRCPVWRRRLMKGTAAHLWQLLMAGQLPVLAFFAIKWLRRAPRPPLYVVAVQLGAALASMAPVFAFNW